MTALPAVLPVVRSAKNVGTFWDITRHLGLTSNMQWCLDAADIVSMPTSADQTWINRGASSINWILGANTTPGSGDEPTFVGAVGDFKPTTYFSFDGGDYYLQTNSGGAQPAFMQRIHADNALFAMAFWCQFNTLSAINGLIATFDGNASVRGSYFRVSSTGKATLLISNASGSLALNVSSTISTPRSRPVFVAVAVDEANGTGFFQINDQQEPFTSTYSSPTSGVYGAAIRVASSSGASHRFEAGNRMYGFWLRESETLTPAEMMSLYNRSRRRFY